MLRRFVSLALVCAPLLNCVPPPPRPPRGVSASWVRIKTPHFILDTDIGAGRGRELGGELERMFAELSAVLSAHGDFSRTPIRFVAFATPDELHRLGGYDLAGMYLQHTWFDLENEPTIAAAMDSDYLFSQPLRELVLHELTHRFVATTYPALPVWFNEGLARYFETMVVENGEAIVGKPAVGDFTTPGITPDAHELLAGDSAWFYGTAIPDVSERTEHCRRTYSAAVAFVNFLRSGPEAYRARFRKYFAELGGGARDSDAWKRAFGDIAPAVLDEDFRAYMQEWSVTGLRVPLKLAVETGGLSVEALSSLDVHVLRARLLRGESLPARAAAELEQAALQGATGPDLDYWRGALALAANDLPSARSAFERALAVRPSDPRFLFGLATALSRDCVREKTCGAPENSAFERTISTLASVANTSAEESLAAWWLLFFGRKDDALRLSDAAVALSPSDGDPLFTRAQLHFALGDYAAAAHDAERALALTTEGRADAAFVAKVREYRERADRARDEARRAVSPP